MSSNPADLVVTLMGKRWRLREVGKNELPKDTVGICHPPARMQKEIRVYRGLTGVEELEIFLHEMGHATDWYKSEEFVSQSAHDKAHALWRLGYRRELV